MRSLGNGKYVVEAVNYNDYLYGYARSWNLVVKVEKVSHSAEEVTVSKYLELNDKTMMLVTVKGTPRAAVPSPMTATPCIRSRATARTGMHGW